MKRLLGKMLLGVTVVTAGVGLGAGVASAGGWAMTSLDVAPQPVAGRTLDVGFTIRQHGVTPVNPQGQVGINVRDASGVEQFFPAVARGRPGHFVAAVRIAQPGATHWEARQGWFAAEDLGPIEVARAGTDAAADTSGAAAATSSGTGTGSTLRGSLGLRIALPVLGVGLAVFAVVDALTTRRRRRSRGLIAT